MMSAAMTAFSPAPDLGDEMSAIRRADHGAAARHDAAGAAPIEHHEIARRQQALEAIEKTEHLEAEFLARERHAAQDGVQARAIAATGQNSDPGLHRFARRIDQRSFFGSTMRPPAAH